ncbi:hypothetical protein N3K66_008550 [Trichothecium roseum]|uniref:Uncharacterized protein n=1 Tax=Trichothecium roseum TaxID=47278 RepID=A0ACC0UQW1_9HYPO|nr:hypothetical protein N3K66_008550 [Trichothecium roseum]
MSSQEIHDEERSRRLTVRVNNIRTRDAQQAEACIREIVERHSTTNDDNCIDSTTVVPSCSNRNSHSALLDLKYLPPFLSGLRESRGRISVPQSPDSDSDVTFDAEFLGLTQTYPTTGQPSADIVFIPGIGGHAYDSWANEARHRRMWPRHFLRHDFPNARAMVFGHGSALAGTDAAHVLDYARGLGNALKQARRDEPHRPLVFVAHGFGGIILQELLISEYVRGASSISTATQGILFFAVPHRGMNVSDMLGAVTFSATGQRLAQISKDGSEWRARLDRFRETVRPNVQVASFYETALTKRLVQNPDGSFAHAGEPVMVTDMESATLGLPDSMESKHPLAEDHFGVIKFDGACSPGYVQATSRLQDMLGNAGKQTFEREDAVHAPLGQLQGASHTFDVSSIDGSQRALLRDRCVWISPSNSPDRGDLKKLVISPGPNVRNRQRE